MANYNDNNIPTYQDAEPFSPTLGDLYDCVRPFKCDYTLSNNEQATNLNAERRY